MHLCPFCNRRTINLLDDDDDDDDDDADADDDDDDDERSRTRNFSVFWRKYQDTQ